MKGLIALAIVTMPLAACAGFAPLSPLTRTQTQTYFAACSAYSTAVDVTTKLLVEGKLNSKQETRANTIILTIAPLCSGALPSNFVTITPKILNSTGTLLNGL